MCYMDFSKLSGFLSLPQPPCASSSSLLCMEAKFVFIFILLFYVNMCISVSPSPSVMRSEPLEKHFQLGSMEMLQITFLGFCLIIFILSQIDHNIRYIPFNVPLNTLTVSKKKYNKNLNLLLLLLLYLWTFEFFFF